MIDLLSYTSDQSFLYCVRVGFYPLPTHLIDSITITSLKPELRGKATIKQSIISAFSALPGKASAELASSSSYYTFIPVYIKDVSGTATFFGEYTNTFLESFNQS